MAKSIMILGTASSAGKSFVTAGLCRIFHQEGFKTAPFKSQNMALNSYITKNHLEMGRAQVMQAEAAGIEPDVCMNPILLKPVSHAGSQVIVNGEVLDTLSAKEYYRKKQEWIPYILKAYQKLDKLYDRIVLEGAGSPAEINLKTVDIVNLGMAKLSHSPAILVGDIDKGGVFASLYGTVALLDKQERTYIKGFIINKFRGDVDILKPGLDMLEKLTDIPVLGVLPYADICLDDEDSLSERLTNYQKQSDAILDIAVIRFPRISNFTDFDVLSRIANVSLRYVTRCQDVQTPDLIILPGTKSTVSDLCWMRQNGLEAAVLKAHADGSILFGICGGMQMLGRDIADPDKVETGGTIHGMDILNIHTVFTSQKYRSQTQSNICELQGDFSPLSGISVHGYEMHMGKTYGDENRLTIAENHQPNGYYHPSQTVWGTYLHGIFDNSEFTQKFIQILMQKKGVSKQPCIQNVSDYKNQQYDKLADVLRENLDMQKLHQILDTGMPS